MKHNPTLLLHFVMALALAGCSNSPSESEAQKEFKKYTNGPYGFSLEYPAGWEFAAVGHPNVVFALQEQKQDAEDQFNEGINIIVFPSQGMTLEQAADTNIKMMMAQNPGYQAGTEAFTTTSGISALLITSEMDMKGMPLTSLSYLLEKGDSLFTMTQAVESSKLHRYKDLLSRSASSFDWTY